MPNFTLPAAEIFQLLQSYDYVVMLYDEDGNRVEDPNLARRFFARPENLMVSIIDNDQDSAVRLYLGKTTHVNDIMGLLLALRNTASKYNLLFNVRQYGRDIEPKDFAGEATVSESAKRKSNMSKMNVFEGLFGTSRSSYLQLENARLIARHSTKVDETKAGARSRCIESILIENAAGERMLFPTNNLSAARAMTQHVNMGGGFADAVGQQIGRMAVDFGNLGACSNYIGNNETSLTESAGAIREQCRSKMREMKKTFEKMYRSNNGYMTEAKKMEDAARALNEGQDTVVPEKIEEMRKTLNLEHSSMLSDAILESVCKAMNCDTDEVKEDMIDEAAPAPATVSVLGRQVNADVWNKLKQGQIDLMGKPTQTDADGKDSAPGYVSKSGELSNKFNAIVPLVKDDSLMNLLAFVTDQFSEESDPTVAKKMRTLMLVVVKAAGESMNEGLAECNKNIREFGRWITSFSPDVRLMPTLNEDFHRSPWHDDANQDAAEAKALDEFDCDEFLQSEYAEDLDRDNEVPVSEVQSALEAYLRSWIETQTGEYVDDVAGIAEQKMSEVIAHLARDGMHITSDEYAESELVEDDMDAGMGGDMDAADAYHMGDEDHREILDDMMDEDDDMGDDMGADMVDEDLTREDILLPNPNQGQDLAREVTPRTVKDPDTGEDKQPDSAYISRLRALSGITSPNRQF